MPEAGLGAIQLAGGLLGVRSGAGGFQRTPSAPLPPSPKGFLRAGPGFVADDAGTVAKFGDTIPMQQAPDGSFVRSVPGEYAKRDVRGLLPAGPRFIADDAGHVASLGQADDAFSQALSAVRRSEPDPSRVSAVPAAVLEREYQGRQLVPTRFSGDPSAVDAPLVNLAEDEVREPDHLSRLRARVREGIRRPAGAS